MKFDKDFFVASAVSLGIILLALFTYDMGKTYLANKKGSNDVAAVTEESTDEEAEA